MARTESPSLSLWRTPRAQECREWTHGPCARGYRSARPHTGLVGGEAHPWVTGHRCLGG